MKKLKLSTKSENRITALILGIAGCVLLSLFFDLFYDMNDDVSMKNILSGIYTGTPQAHDIQMLYPLSLLISIFYRILPTVPWYGLFLTGCLLLSFYLILTRGLESLEKRKEKLILTITVVIIYIGLLLWEMVFVQYTVVCGILAATAGVCLLLTPQGLTDKEFIKKNIVSILLVGLAFNLRTEMLLLMTPFLAIAGILRWSREQKPLQKDNLIKYGTILGSILILLLLSVGIDRIACSSKEWREFNAFFDARTRVYDYTWYPDYEENKEFYDSIHISKAQYNLIENYNFGLDERIDSKIMNQIADYQTEQKQLETNLTEKIKNTLWQYRYLLTHFDLSTQHETRVMPYNLLILLLYVWIILLAVVNRDKSVIWKIPYMWVCRSIPWLYILWGGRVVSRLTHPMYFIETVILFGYLLIEWRTHKQDKTSRPASALSAVCIIIAGIVLLITISGSVKAIREEQTRREEINTTDLAMKEYCMAHPKNYYYLDVYSTVAFSEKMFKDTDKQATNYDLLGGWISKSPLTKEKEKRFAVLNPESDLIEKDNIYFMAEEDADLSWLSEYYAEEGKQITLEKVDILNEDLTINVYKVKN